MTQSILITGANRGIGLELARQSAADGWRVFACCRSPENAEKLQRLAEEHPGQFSLHALDVTQNNDISRLAEELRNQPIDILFNNAGISGPKSQGFGPIDNEEWLMAFHVNAIAPFQVSRAFVDHVAKSSRRIIAIMGTQLGSIADNTSGGRYVYRSSKAAVHMVGKSLSIDLAGRGVTTILLHPGWVRTDMGGAQAALSTEESVQGLRRVLGQATAADNGKLIAFDGRELPW